jgi:hypothetical protein
MRCEYVVILKRHSDRAIDLVSILLCSFSALNFLYAQARAARINYFLVLAALLILGGIIHNILDSRKNKREARTQVVRYKYWLLIAAVGWIGMPYLSWLSVLFILLTFLEYQAKYPFEIGVSGDLVVINTLIRQKYDWSVFNNIVLKDGLLTLDFKNNRLIQKEVLDDDDWDADEDEFNDYCLGRLRAVRNASADSML